MTFFKGELGFKCTECREGTGLNSITNYFEGKHPEFSEPFLPKCQRCDQFYGATQCIFSGEQYQIKECSNTKHVIKHGQCTWEQIEGCKHLVDDQHPECFSCVVGYHLVSGKCEKQLGSPRIVKVLGQRNLEEICTQPIKCDCDYLSFVNTFNEC